MSVQNCDILVEISDVQLPKLAALYEKRATWAPYITSFVCMAMKWKRSEKFRDVLKIFSPKNCWEEDGTIVAIFQFKTMDVAIFTLDDQCTNLFEGLMKTDRIDYMQRVLFYAVHERHIPTFTRYLEAKKIDLTFNNPNYIYVLRPEEATKLTIEIPPKVYVKKLEPSHAKQINQAWPHRYEDSEYFLACFIEINGGYGVFLKSTNELVAWVLKHSFGHLGMLQTEEKHKKKGYGSLIAKVLSKEIGEEGYWPMCSILTNNHASMRLFEKIGFRRNGNCNFLARDPRLMEYPGNGGR